MGYTFTILRRWDVMPSLERRLISSGRRYIGRSHPCISFLVPSPDNRQWVRRPPFSLQIGADLCRYSLISHRMIYGPDSNGTRITLNAKLCTVDSSTIFLRLTEGQQPLFSNLRELDIDTTDTSRLLFLAGPLLDDHFPFGCRGCHGFHLCGWNFRSFTISCVPDRRNYPQS